MAADALASLVKGTPPCNEEVARLRVQAQKAGLDQHPRLYRFVPMSAGASGLAAALEAEFYAWKR